ncbi:MAG: hypothetical protein EOM50_05735, partial [Erysipelotrichia bacterium]|nr:hypothetical protein [Erysipelotrichia bacterium]NCC55450.1 hypothetical protein [Erysipelotrichia bacterium]
MKKKFLSLLACVSMVLTLVVLPTKIVATTMMTQDALEEKINSATAGDTIDLGYAKVELGKALVITKNITIENGELVGKTNTKANLVTLSNANVTFKNVTITSGASEKSALHVYGGSLTADSLKVDHKLADSGAPMIINHGAKVKFSGGLILSLGEKSWYGINVDNAEANFENTFVNYNADEFVGTKSIVCAENNAKVTGLDENFTQVVTALDGGAGTTQTAFVANEKFETFVSAKQSEGKVITKIVLASNVSVTTPLTFSNDIEIIGNGHSIIGTTSLGKENVLTFINGNVTLDFLVVITTQSNKSGIHIYGANVAAKNLIVNNEQTAGGAAIILNGGSLKLDGISKFNLGKNSWGVINIDNTTQNGKTTKLEFANSEVEVTSPKTLVDLFYIDEGKTIDSSITTPSNFKPILNYKFAKFEEDGKLKMALVVTFNEDGNIGVVNLYYGDKVKEEVMGNPKLGYTFKGWYLNGTLFDFTTPITDNITLNAVWEKNKIVEEVDTPVVDPTKPVEDVTVGVNDKASKDVIKETTTSIVDHIINGKDATKNVSKETADKILRAIELGKTITSEIAVEAVKETDVDKTVLKAVNEEVKSLSSDTKVVEVAQYLDLSVLLKTNVNEVLGNIDILDKPITLTVALPKELVKEGRVFYVIRVHEGVAEKLETTLNEDGTLSFATDKFSTYALVYEEKVEKTTPVDPVEPDKTTPVDPVEPDKTTPADTSKKEVKKVDTGDTTNTSG